MDKTGLRRQIEAWYMTSTGAPSGHGALAWCAGQIGVGPKSVKRWFTDSPVEHRELSRQSRASLRLLEQLVVLRYGQRTVDKVLRRLR